MFFYFALFCLCLSILFVYFYCSLCLQSLSYLHRLLHAHPVVMQMIWVFDFVSNVAIKEEL